MSSYEANHYGMLFQGLVRMYQPRKIVEFGILDGYSLDNFIKAASPDCTIEAYDIFEDFPYHHALPEKLKKYGSRVLYGNYYQHHVRFLDSEIDLLHIDIGNDGDTYQHFFQYYIHKLSDSGFALLEGGSSERDKCFQKRGYRKPPIRPVLEKYYHLYNIFVLKPFPSVTMITRR